jgi:ABC-type Fe3+-hydroxamate transport system substrate-binding protein
MIRVRDATGGTIELPRPAEKVVCLVPSTTETVYALGCGHVLVGVTRYCERPSEARVRAAVVGGSKSPRLERIRELSPDLVLANQEENRKEDVLSLRRTAPVQVAYPRTAPDAIAEILKLGALLGRESSAATLAAQLTEELDHLRRAAEDQPFRFLYLIWRNPYMAVGRDTFVSSLLEEAGGHNALPTDRGRYPKLEAGELAALAPDVVMFSSEPYPFESRHVDEFIGALKNTDFDRSRFVLVDGQLLSWHGVRMREGLPYLRRLARDVRASTGRAAP